MVSVHAESDRLHERARAMIHAFSAGRAMPEAFDTLAADIARFQARHVPGYRRLCAARGVAADAILQASEAPAVPTDAFKLAPVFAFDMREAAVTFRTSGTTIGARGAHAMRSTTTYDAAALAFGRAALAGGLTARPAVIVIGPSQSEAPDSSLAHMCALFAEQLGDRASGGRAFVVGGELRVEALRQTVGALAEELPAIVLATSFALVHLLDRLRDEVLALPPGSRVMQTGGYKGRSREVSPAELRREVARLFAVSERAVVSEYGMTELSSQFWEATLMGEGHAHGVFVEPPWARVVPVDPESLAPLAFGEIGIARIEDIANVDSAFAVVAQDRVRRVASGFELLGRSPGAVARGCSIAIDEILGQLPARGGGRG